MKRIFLCGGLILASFIFAQSAMAQVKEEPKAANPADVASMDAIVKAVYEVISGNAGQPREWNRFRSLFYPGARMIGTGKNPKTGIVGARAVTPDEYIQRNTPYFEKEGFFEREKARRTETFGAVTHVFSTYESFHNPNDKTPFERGINSIQLLNDGKRWWVMTIMWQGETKETPLPKKYLKSKN
jgi:hypothetical protein